MHKIEHSLKTRQNITADEAAAVANVSRSAAYKMLRAIEDEGRARRVGTTRRQKWSATWGDFQAEGIVARPKTELKTRSGDRLIAKIKCRDFDAGELHAD